MTSLGHWGHVGLVMLLGLLGARDVYAWGDTGHRIMCEIAFQELTPQARARVPQLLQRDADFTRFSEACTWPDHPRTRAREHFVNLPRAAAQLGDDPCPLDDTCVVTAIDADVAVLSQASAPEMDKLAALKYLGHWVGDVHQPLHVSFEDDRGGNAICSSLILSGRRLDYIARVPLTFGLLAIFGEMESAGASTRKMEGPLLTNNAGFPPRLWTGKRSKISKPPHFTKTDQEPITFTSVRS